MDTRLMQYRLPFLSGRLWPRWVPARLTASPSLRHRTFSQTTSSSRKLGQLRLGLLQEFFHRSPTRRNKERLSRNRIKICGFTFSVHFGQEVSRLPIPSILSIVPVEGADLVCGLKSREIRSIGQCTCQRSTNFVGAKT